MTNPAALSDYGAFHDALVAAGSTVRGKSCTCVWHDDRTPSCTIGQGDDGTWRMYCHACDRHGSLTDLIAHANGQEPRQVFKTLANQDRPAAAPTKRAPPKADKPLVLADKSAVVAYAQRIGTVEAWYTYGAKGSPALVVARILPHDGGKKTFRQFCPMDGGWTPANTIPAGQIPLYRADELAGDRVLVVEGEKCVEACRSVGIQATTSAMGAGKARMSDWTALRGRRVTLWPDNDLPDPKTGKRNGIEHMREVREILEGIGCAVSVINPDGMGLPAKGDVANLIEALDGKDAAEIAATITGIMDDAGPAGPATELESLLRDIEGGRYTAIPWPNLTRLGSLSKALLPGTITSLCADPGAGKSLMMLQMLASWHGQGIPVALLALEDERRVHLQRILAQIVGQSCLTDDEWCSANMDTARLLLNQHAKTIDAIGACIRAEGESQLSLDQIAEWIEAQAKNGARIIIADPVTAAVTEDKPWAADTSFLMRVKGIARRYGASVVLVTHPRGASKGASLGAMAGGSAYPRFSHCALWLSKFDAEDLPAPDGGSRHCNRSVTITKSRHGRGGGMVMGMWFDHDTLRFSEVGTILSDDQRKKRTRRSTWAPDSRDDQDDSPPRAPRMRAKPSSNEDKFV